MRKLDIGKSIEEIGRKLLIFSDEIIRPKIDKKAETSKYGDSYKFLVSRRL